MGPQALRLLVPIWGVAWAAEVMRISCAAASSLLAPPVSGDRKCCSLPLLPVFHSLLPLGLSVQGWGRRGPSFPCSWENPGSGFSKPSLWRRCPLVCGHAADTNENHACHFELRLGCFSGYSVLSSARTTGTSCFNWKGAPRTTRFPRQGI